MKKIMEINWSHWKPMPSPQNCRQIEGPEGPGVYQIRNRNSNQLVLFGESITCQKRMKSFFPKPFGVGTRNNEEKRNYVYEFWKDLDYRTVATKSKEEAVNIDRHLKSLNIHIFNT